MKAIPMAPTTYAYTRHMRSVAREGTMGEVAVVALPCAWIYYVIGQHLLRNGEPHRTHPYREWVIRYGSPEFAEVACWMRDLVDRCAKNAGRAEKARMEEAFVSSSRYELVFWEMAWQEERWPV